MILQICVRFFLSSFTPFFYQLHPGRLTWNLRIRAPWKRKIIFQTIISKFYVNLPGCMVFECSTRWTAPESKHHPTALERETSGPETHRGKDDNWWLLLYGLKHQYTISWNVYHEIICIEKINLCIILRINIIYFQYHSECQCPYLIMFIACSIAKQLLCVCEAPSVSVSVNFIVIVIRVLPVCCEWHPQLTNTTTMMRIHYTYSTFYVHAISTLYDIW